MKQRCLSVARPWRFEPYPRLLGLVAVKTERMGTQEAMGQVGARDLGLQARDIEQTGGSPGVDKLLFGQPRPRTEVGEVALYGARPDAHELGRVSNGSAGGTKAARTSIWRCVACGERAPRRYPSLMRAAWPRRPIRLGPRWACRRL